MSAQVEKFFCYDYKKLDLEKDKTYLSFTLSGWRLIASILTGLSSWMVFGGTTYCLWKRSVRVKTAANILVLSGSLGYLSISYTKHIRHYDQRGSILSYKREIEERLNSNPEEVLAFIKHKHGWNNIGKILQPEEIQVLLLKALPFVDFFSAISKYQHELEADTVKELWSKWSAQKTILELFEECDFQVLKEVLEDVHDELRARKTKWEEAIEPHRRDFNAYRMQTRKDPSPECSERERKYITSFCYDEVLACLKNLEKGFSCKEIEFF